MRFFEISYIPKPAKAFKIVGEILSDSELVNEVNEQVGEDGIFLAKIEVKRKNVKDEAPTVNYHTKVRGDDQREAEPVKVDADFTFQVVSGKKYDCIVVSGEDEHAEMAKILLSHIRTKILPKVDPLQNVIVVKSP